ncbi:MAG: xylulokinase [Propionibacteriaceae bacterium]
MIIAHDLGTTGDKATLVAEDGTLVGSVTAPYGADFGADGKAEQDPNDWWGAFCRATRDLQDRFDVRPEQVAAVSFSGQMMGAVLLDGAGEPVRPAIIWADTRARAQTARLVDEIGMWEGYRITGHRLNPTYSLAKLMWVRDNEPDTFARAKHFLTAKDYLLHRLTGELVTDPSDASGTNAFDQATSDWSAELITASGIDRALFPELLPSTARVGRVRAEVAAEAGLTVDTAIIVGGGDGPMGALGAGILDRSSGAYTYLGSSSWVSFADSKPLHDPKMRSMTFNHVLPGRFVPTATMQSGGASLDWVTSVLMPEDEERFSALLAGAGEATAAASGLFFLPHLLGERSPYWNPRARAAFVGLQMTHDRSSMVRAVLEGVAFNLATGLVAFAEGGVRVQSMDAIGGAAKSPLVQQILADVWQVPIVPSGIGDHATSLGAAAVAALGIGAITEEEVPAFVGRTSGAGVAPTLEPAVVERWYGQFMDAYGRLEGWFEKL